MAVLEVQGICKTFDKNTVVLRGIDFSLEKGESVAIIGSSGSGKTTLLRKKKAKFAENGSILDWFFKILICSRSIRRCRT